MADQALASLLVMIFMLQTGLHAAIAARIGTDPSVEVIEGTRALLPCVVRFDDEPYGLVVWSREPAPDGEDFVISYDLADRKGLKITSGPDSGRFDMVVMNNASFSLVIKNPRKEDEGTYYCKFVNFNAQLTSSNQTVVYVIVKPRLIIEQCQDQMSAREGSSVCNLTHPSDQPLQLNCHLIGVETWASLNWATGGEEGSCSSRSSIVDKYRFNSSVALSLSEEQLPSGYVNYTCFVQGGNIDESLQATAVVYVQTTGMGGGELTPNPCLPHIADNDEAQSDGWKDVFIAIETTLLVILMLAFIYRRRRYIMRKLRTLFECIKTAQRYTVYEAHPPDDKIPLLEPRATSKGKIYRSDPIHQKINMPEYCQIFIDTPEFQRMRCMKQLGCACYVYPAAVHTRFEHSIGVCHLAGVMIDTLRENGAEISEVDARCVRIAGLCHDLGHGPFSFDFESIIPANEKGTIWKHEEQSVEIFKYLVENHGLKDKLKDCFGLDESHLDLIRHIILGLPKEGDERFYLIQVVNNWKNGIDVDKWDYMKRDSSCLGIPAPDIDPIFESACVSEVMQTDGSKRKEICFPEKVREHIHNMFSGRKSLHKKVYKHRVVSSIMFMIRDALTEASEELQYTRKDGQKCSLVESVQDPHAFCELDDTILNEISRSQSNSEGIRKAKEIISRIHTRDLYQVVGEIRHAESEFSTRDKLNADTILQWIDKNMATTEDIIWKKENIQVEVCHFDYWRQDKNPFDVTPFKEEDGTTYCYLTPPERLSIIPSELETIAVRIYTKVSSGTRPVNKKDIEDFKEKARKKGLMKREQEQTPMKREREQTHMKREQEQTHRVKSSAINVNGGAASGTADEAIDPDKMTRTRRKLDMDV